jgi:hypothetical protein
MKLVTKYDIGHTFWVPRSRKKFVTETLTWEGEEWNREVVVYEAYTNQKKIIKIEVVVNHLGKSYTKYGTINTDIDPNAQMMSYYGEKDITNYLEEEAMTVATEHAEQKKEYYGKYDN